MGVFGRIFATSRAQSKNQTNILTDKQAHELPAAKSRPNLPMPEEQRDEPVIATVEPVIATVVPDDTTEIDPAETDRTSGYEPPVSHRSLPELAIYSLDGLDDPDLPDLDLVVEAAAEHMQRVARGYFVRRRLRRQREAQHALLAPGPPCVPCCRFDRANRLGRRRGKLAMRQQIERYDKWARVDRVPISDRKPLPPRFRPRRLPSPDQTHGTLRQIIVRPPMAPTPLSSAPSS